MKTTEQYLKHCQHRIGWLGTAFLMSPILFWVWLLAERPVISVFNGAVPRMVLSGEVFTAPFNWIHAGGALDQPTIGRSLVWFTAMAMTSLPYAMAVRWLSDRRKASGRIAFGVSVVTLSVFLLCILSWPLLWLIQYVCDMGVTPRRIFGLCYSFAGVLLVIGFLYWALRKPEEKDDGYPHCTECDYNLTGNVSGVCPECGEQI
jgi:hypothetical protein